MSSTLVGFLFYRLKGTKIRAKADKKRLYQVNQLTVC